MTNFLTCFHVNKLHKQTIQTHLREETNKELVRIKVRMVIFTQHETIAGFMMGIIFGQLGQPPTVLKV